MEAIILAGGLGTRLRSVISDIPKPMAPVAGKPFLQYVLQWLKENSVNKVILSVGYKWEAIYEAFGNVFDGIDISYSIENSPLGTGGAIALAMKKAENDQFFILNGDTFLNSPLRHLSDFHQYHSFDLSVLLKPMNDFNRYGTVEIDDDSRITAFHEKVQCSRGLINGGVYLANRCISRHFSPLKAFSFEKDFLEVMPGKLKFGGLIADHYFVDIGIPSDYLRAQAEFPYLSSAQ